MSKKILVAYFSASGETEQAAEALAIELNADIHEIEPEILYTTADLDWKNQQSRSSVEMNDSKSRPAIVEMQLDLTEYDEILIGYPIWWDLAPTIINTFLEKYDFAGKKVRVFATSGGSIISHSEMKLHKQYPMINWETGKLLNTSHAIKQFADTVR